MALSMDEQRMLAEIERRLAAEDPGLATRLSSFRRQRPVSGFRSAQGKIIGSICTVVLLAVIAVTVYATIAARAHSHKGPVATQSATRTSQPPTSQPASVRAPSARAQVPAPSATRIIGVDGTPAHNG